MKKTLSTALIMLASLSFANAQTPNPDIINPENLAQLQKLSKQTRDSLIVTLKASKNLVKKHSIKINGKDMSEQMSGPMNKFSALVTELMIDVLSSDDPVVARKSQEKYEFLAEQVDHEMDALEEKLDYEEKRQHIIDKFNDHEYDDAKEKREAKQEMNEDLRELKKDYKEKVKENAERYKKEMAKIEKRQKKMLAKI